MAVDAVDVCDQSGAGHRGVNIQLMQYIAEEQLTITCIYFALHFQMMEVPKPGPQSVQHEPVSAVQQTSQVETPPKLRLTTAALLCPTSSIESKSAERDAIDSFMFLRF